MAQHFEMWTFCGLSLWETLCCVLIPGRWCSCSTYSSHSSVTISLPLFNSSPSLSVPATPHTLHLKAVRMLSPSVWGWMGGFGIILFSSLTAIFFFAQSLHFVILHVRAHAEPWIDVHWQPPCLLSLREKGGWEREQKKRERQSMRNEKEMIFWFLIFYKGFVVLEGCLYVCF